MVFYAVFQKSGNRLNVSEGVLQFSKLNSEGIDSALRYEKFLVKESRRILTKTTPPPPVITHDSRRRIKLQDKYQLSY